MEPRLRPTDADGARDRGWFVALAPADSPAVVIVVATDAAPRLAAPIAADVVRAWYALVGVAVAQ
jgi:cell division protein FtsI/penicillin-binding protein 2